MKKIVIFILSICPISVIAQSDNVLLKQGSNTNLDTAAYQASYDFSYFLNQAGKYLTMSAVFEGLAAGGVIIGSMMATPEEPQKGKILRISGYGCAIVGIIMLLTSGSDLKKASEKYQRIHPIPNGVSIDL